MFTLENYYFEMVRGWCKQYCDEHWHCVNLNWNVSSLDGLFNMLDGSSYHCHYNTGLLKHLANKSGNLYLISSLKNFEKKWSHLELKDLPLIEKITLVGNRVSEKDSDLIVNSLLENRVTVGQLWDLCSPRLIDDHNGSFAVHTGNLILDASTSLLNFYYSIKVCM